MFVMTRTLSPGFKSETGPYMEEREFDKLLVREVRSLVRSYGISYDPDEVVPSDNTLARDLWRAAYELVLRVGGYNMSTKRRLVFEEWEVKAALKNIPERIVIGCGEHARVMAHRGVEDPTEPLFETGPTGTVVSEDIYLETMISFAQEDFIDAVGSGSLATINGLEIKTGSPLEVMAATHIAAMNREALRKVGREGMHINDVAITTPWAKMAAVNEGWGIRRCDSMLVAQMIELKTSNEHLALAEFMLRHGIVVSNLMTPIWGGYGGDSPGTAVISLAEHIFGALVYGALKHFLSLTHYLTLNNTSRETLWVISTVGQAIAMNSKLISLHDCYSTFGPGTKEILYESAAGAVTSSVSGLHGTGIGSAGGKYPDHETGIEGRLYGEVAKHSVRFSRRDANDIVKEILKRYEGRLRKLRGAVPGKSIRELYDLRSVRPSREWLSMYSNVRKELIDLGIPLD
ncbi:MAG: hypothetical protein B6U73_00955 [Desulfurococcales archaeon ex4484_204]|nr:MAG: hypothetical protein B6U73_00955 [Desulfurococcales archaeon ex4484_204]